MAVRNEERLKIIADDIGHATYVQTDVTSLEDLEGLVRYTLKQYGKIDVLVNNVGLQLNSKLNELKIAEWDQSLT